MFWKVRKTYIKIPVMVPLVKFQALGCNFTSACPRIWQNFQEQLFFTDGSQLTSSAMYQSWNLTRSLHLRLLVSFIFSTKIFEEILKNLLEFLFYLKILFFSYNNSLKSQSNLVSLFIFGFQPQSFLNGFYLFN